MEEGLSPLQWTDQAALITWELQIDQPAKNQPVWLRVSTFSMTFRWRGRLC